MNNGSIVMQNAQTPKIGPALPAPALPARGVVPRYVTEAELIVILGLKSKRTLSKWRAAREGPVPTFCGGAVRYEMAAVESWLESRKFFKRPVRRKSVAALNL